MKANISLLAIILAFFVTSCSNNETIEEVQSQVNKVTLNVKTALNTRNGTTTETVITNRYVMEIWENADCTVPANVFDTATTPTNRKTVTDGIFTVNLDRNKNYTCLFWADNNGDNVYEVSNLKAVTLKSGAEPIDAFSTVYAINSAQPSQTILLNRAVAKFTLNETDFIPANSTLKTVYLQNTTFNVLTQKADTPVTRTQIITIPNDVNATSTSMVSLGYFYTLANVNSVDKQLIIADFTLNTETGIQLTGVPVQANHNTNINCEYSRLTGRTFSIGVDNSWGTPESSSVLPIFS